MAAGLGNYVARAGSPGGITARRAVGVLYEATVASACEQGRLDSEVPEAGLQDEGCERALAVAYARRVSDVGGLFSPVAPGEAGAG